MLMTQSSVGSENSKNEERLSRTIIQMKEDNDNLKPIMKETYAGSKALAKKITQLNDKLLR